MQRQINDVTLIKSDRDKFIDGASRAIASEVGYAPFDPQNEFNGLSLYDLAELSNTRSLLPVSKMRDRLEVVQRAYSTSDFPLLLENITHRAMTAGWNEFAPTYPQVVRIQELPDFKEASLMSIYADPSKIKVMAELEEYPEGELVESSSAIQLETAGVMFSIGRQSIINNDTNAFREANLYGNSMAKFVNSTVYNYIYNNPTLKDNVALFDASRNNTTSGEASVDSLDAVRTQFKEGYNLNTVLAPKAIQGKMNVIASALTINNQENPLSGTFKVVSDGALDLNSSSEFYLLDTTRTPIIMGVLAGHPNPSIQIKTEFRVDVIRWKLFFDFAVGAGDPNAIIRVQ